MYPFERFTEGSKQVLTRAQEEAKLANQRYIGTEHIALALCHDDGAAGRALADLGITFESLKAQVGDVLDTAERPPTPQIVPTSRVKRVIEIAFQEATSAGAEQVGTEHLLVALLVEAEGTAPQALDRLGATLPKVRRAIRAALAGRTGHGPRTLDAISVTDAAPGFSVPGAPVGTASSLGVALMRAGQLAQQEGTADIRADHLIRAIAATDASDLRGTLRRLGLTAQAVDAALTVPEEVRQLGLSAMKARIEHAGDFATGGEGAADATRATIRAVREYADAVSRWLTEDSS